MGNIFTRKAVDEILRNENLTPEERLERMMALQGRALDEGYVSKTAAQEAREAAVQAAKEEALKSVKTPDPKDSEEYKALAGQFETYKTMQTARASEEFSDVKPKFFETVYGMVKREDGAKPVKEQLADIRKEYEEYFSAQQPANPKPAFGAPLEGAMPKGDEGAQTAFEKAWGFVPQKKG